MIEMRVARPDEVARQRELWTLAFGDGDQYLDFVYANGHLAEILVLLEDGQIQSMTFLYPMPLTLPDGSTATSAYVYALATHPDARGKGYARMLLKYVDFFLQEKGLDCVTIVPAEPSLHTFFGTTGFLPCFATGKTKVLAQNLPPVGPRDTIRPVEGTQYQEIRRELLKGSAYIDYSTDLMDYQAGLSQMFGGNLYLLEVDGIRGLSVAERHSPQSIVTKEFLLPPQLQSRGAALLAQVLPGETYELRTPTSWVGEGQVEEFGMVKCYNATTVAKISTLRDAYLGLAFD